MSHRYTLIPASDCPRNLRWDTPRQHQGQHVEVSYAEPHSAYEAGPGSGYKRVIDHGVGTTPTYYRLVAE